jgi:hypothetical protein
MIAMRHYRGHIDGVATERQTIEGVLPTDPLISVTLNSDLLTLRLGGQAQPFVLQTLDAARLFVGAGDEVEIAGVPQSGGVLIYGVRNLTDGVVYLVHPYAPWRRRAAHVFAAILGLPGVAMALYPGEAAPRPDWRELALVVAIGPVLAYGAFWLVDALGLRSPLASIDAPGDTDEVAAACRVLSLAPRRRSEAVRI